MERYEVREDPDGGTSWPCALHLVDEAGSFHMARFFDPDDAEFARQAFERQLIPRNTIEVQFLDQAAGTRFLFEGAEWLITDQDTESHTLCVQPSTGRTRPFNVGTKIWVRKE